MATITCAKVFLREELWNQIGPDEKLVVKLRNHCDQYECVLETVESFSTAETWVCIDRQYKRTFKIFTIYLPEILMKFNYIEWELDGLKSHKIYFSGHVFFNADDRYGYCREHSERKMRKRLGYSVKEYSELFIQFLGNPLEWTPENHREWETEFRRDAFNTLLLCKKNLILRDLKYILIKNLSKIYKNEENQIRLKNEN